MYKWLFFCILFLLTENTYCQQAKLKHSIDTSFNSYVKNINSRVGYRAYKHVYVIVVNGKNGIQLSYNVEFQEKRIQYIDPTHIGILAGKFVFFRINSDTVINRVFNLMPYSTHAVQDELEKLKRNNDVVFEGEFLSRLVYFEGDSIISDNFTTGSQVPNDLWIYHPK
jgi:hypothetical protein